jgi:hypothetical protein
MVSGELRSVLLRSSAAVRFLLLALFAAPQLPDPVVPAALPLPLPAHRVTVLIAQFTAGVRGSRAPPAASV